MLNRVLFRLRVFTETAALVIAAILATAGAYAITAGLVAPPQRWFVLILLTGVALRAVTCKVAAPAER